MKLFALLFLYGIFTGISCSEEPSPTSFLKLEPIYRNVIRNINETYIVKCYIIGEGTLNALTWVGPHGHLTSNGRVRVETTWIEQNRKKTEQATLIMENLREEDAGKYECQSPATIISASFQLEIDDPIQSDPLDKTQFAVVGQEYTLKCNGNKFGNEVSRYWKIDGKSIDYTRMASMSQGLLINTIYKNDSDREYTCTTYKLAVRPQSKRQTIKLIVLTRELSLITSYATVGQNTKLYCKEGKSGFKNNSVEITWYDNQNQHVIPSHENGVCIRSVPEENLSILQVPIKDENDLGNYTCVLKSENRTVGYKVNLIKKATNILSNPNSSADDVCTPILPSNENTVTLNTSTDANEGTTEISLEPETENHNHVTATTMDSEQLSGNGDILEINSTVTTKTSAISTVSVRKFKNEDGSFTTITSIKSEETTEVTSKE